MNCSNISTALNYYNLVYNSLESRCTFLQRKFPEAAPVSAIAKNFFFYGDFFALIVNVVNLEIKWRDRNRTVKEQKINEITPSLTPISNSDTHSSSSMNPKSPSEQEKQQIISNLIKMSQKNSKECSQDQSIVERDRQSIWDTCMLIVRLFGILTLAGATVYGINRWTKPSFNLQTLFKGTLPSNVSISVDWENPTSKLIKQWILTSRIFVHLVTAYISSTDRAYDLTSAALQTFSLFNLSQISSLTLTRTEMDHPLKSIHFEVVKGGGRKKTYLDEVEMIESKFHWRVPSDKLKDEVYLGSVVEEIEKYSSGYFQNSFWNSHWDIYNRNSGEYLRKLVYKVQIKTPPLSLQSFPKPILTEIEARSYGKAEWINHLKYRLSRTSWWEIKLT